VETQSAQDRPLGLILLYHRVDEIDCDPWGLSVRPDRFAQHLQCIRQFGSPASVSQVVQARHGKKPSRPLIAVTFDDGYVDNLNNAAPLLQRFDVPATIYLVTGAIGADREFWWDELERLLLVPVELPETVDLGADEGDLRCSLGDARRYDDASRSIDRIWVGRKEGPTSARFEFFRKVHGRLMTMQGPERRKALDQIVQWAGAGSAGRKSYLCVSREEAAALDRFDQIDLGAHTETHAALAGLSPAAQTHEIRASKEGVAALIGRSPTSFAYPYGSCSGETAKLVRDEKFASACTTRAGVIAQDCDAYLLPRVKIGDWDRGRFESALAAWLGAP